MMLLRGLLLIVWLSTVTWAAKGQDLVTTMSDRVIEISSNFSGRTITIFGALSTPLQSASHTHPLSIKMTLLGPDEAIQVRKKHRIAYIWVNTEKQIFAHTPSFAALLTSKNLDRGVYETAQSELFARLAPQLSQQEAQSDSFATQLIRLRRKQNHVQIKAGAIELLSPTVFVARIELPTTIASGTYLVTTEIFTNTRYLASSVDSFDVRKSGIERFIFEASSDVPWAYGLATLILALFTGWLGSVIFKRT